MGNQNLAMLLKEVEDVKQEYYVGTSEAFMAVKARMRLYDNPPNLVRKINEQLGNSDSYKANTERLGGIMSMIQISNHLLSLGPDGVMDRMEDIFEKPQVSLAEMLFLYGDNNQFGNFLFGCFDDGLDDYSLSEDKFRTMLVSLFRRANFDEVDSDDKMKDYVALDMYSTLKEMNLSAEDFDEEDKGEVDNAEDLYLALCDLNAEEIFSRDNFIELERMAMFDIERAYLRTDERVKRLKNDMVEHRLEYRRNMLSIFLRQESDIQGAENVSYESLVQRQDEIIKKHEGRKKLFGIDSPLNKHENEALDEARFIRHLLGSDRNFVRRFLEG